MTRNTGDQVVHIGENAELTTRANPQFAGRLELDDPIDADSPATTISALSAATELMHGAYWRPAIIDVHSPETGREEPVLVFVNDDNPTEAILVCPADTPEGIQEATA